MELNDTVQPAEEEVALGTTRLSVCLLAAPYATIPTTQSTINQVIDELFISNKETNESSIETIEQSPDL
jgi:hypothetical protein